MQPLSLNGRNWLNLFHDGSSRSPPYHHNYQNKYLWFIHGLLRRNAIWRTTMRHVTNVLRKAAQLQHRSKPLMKNVRPVPLTTGTDDFLRAKKCKFGDWRTKFQVAAIDKAGGEDEITAKCGVPYSNERIPLQAMDLLNGLSNINFTNGNKIRKIKSPILENEHCHSIWLCASIASITSIVSSINSIRVHFGCHFKPTIQIYTWMIAR